MWLTYLLQYSRTKFCLQQELPLANCLNSVSPIPIILLVTNDLRGQSQIKNPILNVDLMSKSWTTPPHLTKTLMYIFDQNKDPHFPNIFLTHTKILFCILTAVLENVTLPSNSYCLHNIVNCRNRLLKTKTRKLPPQCCFPI